MVYVIQVCWELASRIRTFRYCYLLLAAGSSNGVTNTRCCIYSCLRCWWWVAVTLETSRAVSRQNKLCNVASGWICIRTYSNFITYVYVVLVELYAFQALLFYSIFNIYFSVIVENHVLYLYKQLSHSFHIIIIKYPFNWILLLLMLGILHT